MSRAFEEPPLDSEPPLLPHQRIKLDSQPFSRANLPLAVYPPGQEARHLLRISSLWGRGDGRGDALK